MEALVSIVVPVYNVEQYLDDCVTSLVNQTYQNIEIILVDDGSTDRSPQLCDRWAERDGRIRVIHQSNAGAGMSRNTGMDHAGGKYIFFIDSDDYIDLTTVEKCVGSAREHDAQAVVFGRKNVHEDGRITCDEISAPALKFSGDAIRSDLLPNMFTYGYGFGATAAGRMHDLEVLKKHGLRFVSERELLSEDSILTLELFAVIRTVSIVPEGLYYYRRRPDSVSRRFLADRQTVSDRYLTYCEALCQRLGYPPRIRRHIEARYQIYSLAHMKQIIGAEAPAGEKYRCLRSVFADPLLLDSISEETLALCNRASRIFWKLFRKRRFLICCLLLWYKSRRS